MENKIFQEDFFVHSVLHPNRSLHMGVPVKEIGYLDSVKVTKDITYDKFLEITIRLSSHGEEKAVDVLNGKRFETPFPHVLIKKPGVHHFYSTLFPRKAFFFQYSIESFQRLQEIGVCFDPLVWQITLTDSLQYYIQKLTNLTSLFSLPLMREKADAFCWLLLLELLESRNKNNVYSDLYKKIQDIAVYIQAHCLEISSISELARAHGFSERSFLRHWMTFFSETPLQMIIRYKLEYACSCLRYTDMTISSIAEALQFSAIYFDRLFYKKIGMTPRQYRNACNSK